ncbi:MAG TPA: NUDIX domain-containing protein [Blastocatellia bacterium]|nr:NUDIX domain-containing protein [Blastocatellia bacterium]
MADRKMAEMKAPNRRPQVGMGVLVMRRGRALLGRRRNSHGEGYYAAPGGHVEFGESFEHAARREVREETGLEIEDLRLLSVGNYVFKREDGERHYIDVDFVCEAPVGEAQLMEPEKCGGWDWYDLDNLPQPLFIVTRRMIESLRSGVTLTDPSEIERQ